MFFLFLNDLFDFIFSVQFYIKIIFSMKKKIADKQLTVGISGIKFARILELNLFIDQFAFCLSNEMFISLGIFSFLLKIRSLSMQFDFWETFNQVFSLYLSQRKF